MLKKMAALVFIYEKSLCQRVIENEITHGEMQFERTTDSDDGTSTSLQLTTFTTEVIASAMLINK